MCMSVSICVSHLITSAEQSQTPVDYSQTTNDHKQALQPVARLLLTAVQCIKMD